ncbi:branched-chain amino acid ABC transporter permease [Acidimicrobiia bacterium EGI L10123]|uniref:ABC transporter permease subunit n=1 Tax=Salinilacustrithrix flava TaxID=2957203 RepID=UPI003D7C14E2|nr:branched-chain amino acid ABC transporter permease [Acidimicrobiia bacterium EGI L10123]
MPAAPRRLLLLLVALTSVLGFSFVGAGAASAQDATEEPGDPEATPEAEEAAEDESIASVVGSLKYDDEEDNEVPVEGVEISATGADGEEVAIDTTAEDGTFLLELPEPGEYTFTVNPDTIPDGISLRSEERGTTTFSLSPGQQRTVLFPLVEGEARERSSGSTKIAQVPQLAFEGFKFGLIIAMSAVGLSLIYGTTGLVNFAHGEVVTFGALLAYLFNVTFGLHLLIAGPIAVLLAGVFGGGFDRGFWRPLRNRGTSLIAMLVVSIGLSLVLRYIFLYQFGGRTRPFDQYAIQTDTIEFLNITMVRKDIWIVVVSIILLVLVALALGGTRIGKATRAVADNRDLAESSGIDVEKVILVVWAVGSGLAAVGGIFLGLTEQVSWQGGFQLLLLMFAGVTLGGLGTAYGALVGSIIVGLAVQLSTLVISSELKNVAALLILAFILLVRPQGILGRKERVG